jgi:hypothetical protein
MALRIAGRIFSNKMASVTSSPFRGYFTLPLCVFTRAAFDYCFILVLALHEPDN